MIGKMLGNRYKILEKLGGGGMAIVYKGLDSYLNREVTIKVMRPEFTSDEDFVQRFRREAQAVARLSHANIVNIHDVGQEDYTHYLVMEYVRGDNLKNIIKQKGKLEPEEAVRIAVQVCEALEHAHKNNIVHRDIKPHNILITADGRAKLTDFGIAMEATAGTITRTDTIMGSVHYLSPEQARGETATAKSDIYAVGILLYEMLTGKQPYSGDSPIAIALKHIQETPPPVNEVNPEVPAELAEVVNRAMEKRPELRYRSAGELARRLEAAIEDTAQNTVILPVGGGIDDIDKKGSEYAPGGAGRNIDGQKAPEESIPRTWTWIAVLVLITGLIAGGVYGFYNYMDVPTIKVPSVIGLTEERARDELESLGLKVEVQESHSQEEEGIVIDQDYGPEDPEVKPGRVITITVSKGPDLKTVPDLVGLTVSDAYALLVEYDLTLVQPPGEEHHPDAPKGTIIEQTPGAGEKAARGSEVKVVLSLGPEPEDKVMPDLRGMTLNEAMALLAGMNLVIDRDNVSWDESTEYLRGQIIGQKPNPGTVVSEGTEVEVVVNSGPGPVERQANVTVKNEIPDDGKPHAVEIVVEDVQGRDVVYAGNHTAGDIIKEKITYLGQGRVQVYVDGQIIREEPLP